MKRCLTVARCVYKRIGYTLHDREQPATRFLFFPFSLFQQVAACRSLGLSLILTASSFQSISLVRSVFFYIALSQLSFFTYLFLSISLLLCLIINRLREDKNCMTCTDTKSHRLDQFSLSISLFFSLHLSQHLPLSTPLSHHLSPPLVLFSESNKVLHAHPPVRAPLGWHIVRTVVHFFHFSLAYLLMLVAMTFSVGLFLSVMTGVATGYFIFERRLDDVDAPRMDVACH